MNIIRTRAMELTNIPAIAWRQKLASGGAGVKVMRFDREASAVVTIDRRSGAWVPYRPYETDLFPDEAFDEALELLEGLPYSARGKIVLKQDDAAADDVASGDAAPDSTAQKTGENAQVDHVEAGGAVPDMTDSPEYRAIVERYCDEKRWLNYKLMNKDFIQFAARSKTVGDMVDDMALTDDILRFVVQSRAAVLAGRKDSLDLAHTDALIETLDEIAPRSAFKELKAYINKRLAQRKL